MRYLILTLLLTGCIVGQLPTDTPTPTATLWATNTVTATLTAVNISPTPEPSPTVENACALIEGTILWADDGFALSVGIVQYGETNRSTGRVPQDWETVVLRIGQVVTLLPEQTETARRVLVWDSPELVGWIPLHSLPIECRE